MAVAQPCDESAIPLDHDDLAELRNVVALAGKSNPPPDLMPVFHVVLHQPTTFKSGPSATNFGGTSMPTRRAKASITSSVNEMN